MALTGPAPRTVAYYPAVDGKGKYHAANAVIDTPICGAPVVLDTNAPVHVTKGQDLGRVHPIVCRKCLKAAQGPA